MNLKEFKSTFDPHLRAVLVDRIEESLRGKGALSFKEFWRYPLVLAESGKRLRPYLAYLGYTVLGGTSEEEIFRVGVGLELFHTFCLIHDDIMDQDLERRGVPTTHRYIYEALAGKVTEEHRARISESFALLIGDDVFAWARELLSDPRIAERLRYMVDEVILGQAVDVLLAGSKTASREDLDHMMLLKTAGYSFAQPLLIGGELAGMNQGQAEFFERFGKALGLAFQLQDDYFDRARDLELDRPTYYTRGYEAEGLLLRDEKFSEAGRLLDESGLSVKSQDLLRNLLTRIRERKE